MLIADKTYDDFSQVTYKIVGHFVSTPMVTMKFPIYEDIYGRRVIHLSECYHRSNSYDLPCEHHVLHWYFIRHEDGLALIFYDASEDECVITNHYTRESVGFRVNPDRTASGQRFDE